MEGQMTQEEVLEAVAVRIRAFNIPVFSQGRVEDPFHLLNGTECFFQITDNLRLYLPYPVAQRIACGEHLNPTGYLAQKLELLLGYRPGLKNELLYELKATNKLIEQLIENGEELHDHMVRLRKLQMSLLTRLMEVNQDESLTEQ